MSTRSTIGRLNDDGTVTAIYCHFDGYLEHVGATLYSYYQDSEKITTLLNLGDVSSLKEEIGEPHDFDERFSSQDPRARWTRFYGRDRGENGIEAREFPNAATYWSSRRDYQYLFADGAWLVKAYDGEIKPLSDALAERGNDDEDDD